MKVALITGITGQDGSYLAELLLSKGYQVHGVVRRHSQGANYPHIDHIQHQLHLHMGDLSDSSMLRNLIQLIQPQEVYNLAAQSHVHVSFQVPEYTCDTNSLGVLRMLEAVRQQHEQGHQIKFYQAGTSEMFGRVYETPQTECTPFRPRSPYGVSKVFAHHMTVNYRESYHMHASNGILFNHESVRRGKQFVTRKITYETARVLRGLEPCVKLGNLHAQRDWGHARDFVRGMWQIMQQPDPGDYVLATGVCHSVKEFCERVAAWHNIPLVWRGDNDQMQGVNEKTGQIIYQTDPEFYRPAEVDMLMGDAQKAVQQLNWQPEITFDQMIHEMCAHDWQCTSKEHAHA